jgi:succinate dehydrogenase/fumarate reductase-like Fe-S protein
MIKTTSKTKTNQCNFPNTRESSEEHNYNKKNQQPRSRIKSQSEMIDCVCSQKSCPTEGTNPPKNYNPISDLKPRTVIHIES